MIRPLPKMGRDEQAVPKKLSSIVSIEFSNVFRDIAARIDGTLFLHLFRYVSSEYFMGLQTRVPINS